MSFFRTFQHLLPDGKAWRLTVEKRLRQFFEGLSGGPQAVVDFVDDVHDDLYPQTTRELEGWEKQFDLASIESDAERRAALEAAWAATGGQSPRYLQDVLQAAGFDLYVYDWWSSSSPYVPRDPRTYTTNPTIGTVQCGEDLAECGEPDAQCNAFLANEPGYLVNLDLTPTAPPAAALSDNTKWPYFVYVGGTPFGTLGVVRSNRRAELEKLLLRLFPAHLWIVTLVNYVDSRVTLAGEPRVTLADDLRVTLD